MHMRNRALRVPRARVNHVCNPAIRHELLVHRHLELGDVAVGGKDFAQVGGIDVFGQFFYDDFGAARG